MNAPAVRDVLVRAQDLARMSSGSSGRAIVQEAAPPSRAWNLKKLKPRHLQIASLYVSGIDRASIAALCDCTPELVTMLLQQPVFVEHVKGLQAQLDQDMHALYGKAIRSVDRALDEGQDTKDQLRAADMIFRARGVYEEKGKANATAEDIVQRLLQINAGDGATVNVQVNVAGSLEED